MIQQNQLQYDPQIMKVQISLNEDQKIEPACEEILGHSSEASLATGPVMALPLVSPLLFTITPALSSQQMYVPSGLLQGLLCLMMTAGWSFFLTLSLPFLQEHMTTSPMEPAGSRLRRPLTAMTAMMKRFLAPELSAQFMVAATGNPRVIRSLIPTAPVFDFLAIQYYKSIYLFHQFLTQPQPNNPPNPQTPIQCDIINDVIKQPLQKFPKKSIINCRQVLTQLKTKRKQQKAMIRNDYDYLFKFILVGDTNVGKSCMLMRLLENRFRSQHQPTLGVEFGSRMFSMKDRTIKLQIWDTAGQQSFKSITRAYYKGSIAALLVFDITSQKSFSDLNNWLYEIKSHSHQKIHIVMVGNKKDLTAEREVSEERAMQFAKENQFMGYYQVSALNGENIGKPFVDLMAEVLHKIESGAINLETDAASGVKVGPKIRPKYVGSNIELSGKDEKKKLDEANKCSC